MSSSPDPSSGLPPYAEALARAIIVNPYCAYLGMQLVSFAKGRAILEVPYRADLAGAASGIIAGGVVTALLDNVCGAAAGTSLTAPAFVATINLRIDYMRPATPGLTIIGEGECFKLTRHVAFVRGLAYETDRDDAVAHCVAAFMINPIPDHLGLKAPGS